MQANKITEEKPRPSFSLGSGFIPYILVLLFSVIFTEAMKSPISVVLFWFMVLLPFFTLLYGIIARNSVTVFTDADEVTAEKLSAVGYMFSIANTSILPIPYISVRLSLPHEEGVFCTEKSVSLSLLPRGEYIISDTVKFKYRGRYHLGVGDVYVTDILKMFVFKREIDRYYKIDVIPRKLHLDRGGDNAPSDMPKEKTKLVSGIETSEANRIRDYRAGDQLKHIHWKLSSKLDELQVNEYSPSTGKNVYVFCDFSEAPEEASAENEENIKNEKKKKGKRRVKLNIAKRAVSSAMTPEEMLEAERANAASRAEAAAALAELRAEIEGELIPEKEKKPELDLTGGAFDRSTLFGGGDYFKSANVIRPEYRFDMDHYVADGVSEIAIGAVMRELDDGNTVTLMWFDERVEMGFSSYTLHSYADLEMIFYQFSTTPLVPSEYKVTRLANLILDVENPTFIYATSRADLSTLADFAEAANSMGAEASEIMLFNPSERYESPTLRREYIEVCRERFAESNITLTEISLPALGETEQNEK